MKKYLDSTGLTQVWTAVKTFVGNAIANQSTATTSAKGLMSAEDKTKLNGIEADADVNIIESIKVNGTAQTITNKAVDITVPTKTSDLTNDDNVVKDASYVHTDNNYTNDEKTKLSGIAAGAEVNVLESISVNGTAQTITSKGVDISVPTNNNQLTNGAGYQTASDVESAIDAKISSAYKIGGSKTASELTSALLVAANEGKVFNMSEAITTTADFVEGAGKAYPAGTNVAVVNTGTSGSPVYKFDVLAGFINVSDLENTALTQSEIEAILV